MQIRNVLLYLFFSCEAFASTGDTKLQAFLGGTERSAARASEAYGALQASLSGHPRALFFSHRLREDARRTKGAEMQLRDFFKQVHGSFREADPCAMLPASRLKTLANSAERLAHQYAELALALENSSPRFTASYLGGEGLEAISEAALSNLTAVRDDLRELRAWLGSATSDGPRGEIIALNPACAGKISEARHLLRRSLANESQEAAAAPDKVEFEFKIKGQAEAAR